MSNKRKQTALDLDQKIAIISEIEGAKTGSSCGCSRSVETSSKIDIMLLLCCLMA